MKNTAPTKPEQLHGVVKHLTYVNPENGYFVAKVTVAGKGEKTVVGNAPVINIGEHISAHGSWQSSNWGPQFKASDVTLSAPTMLEGIEKYLANAIEGIGKGYAKKMVDAFGEAVFDVIEQTPEKLNDVRGIGPKRAASIVAAYAEQKAIRTIMVFLHKSGLSTTRAKRVYDRYGADAVEKIKRNPYILCRDIWGIGFSTADAVAAKQGIAPTSEYRVRAGIQHTLIEANNQGSCGLPLVLVREKAAELLEVDYDLIDRCIQFEIESKDVIKDTASGVECLFLPKVYNEERYIARRLLAMAERAPVKPIANIDESIMHAEVEIGLLLEDAQRDAVRTALASQVCVITGGPGTGKCVVEGTLVHTAAGLLPIEQLAPEQMPAEDDSALIDVPVVTREGWSRARGFYNGGKKQTLRMVTEAGFELSGTHVHPVLVGTPAGPQWKPLSEVQPGDWVGVSVGAPETVGAQYCAHRAYLAGMFVGDGAFSSGNRVVTGCDVEELRIVQALLRDKLDADSVIFETENRAPGLRLRGAAALALVTELELWDKTAHSKSVPAVVLQGGSAAWRGFLRGLWDADGTVDRRGYVSFATVSEELARQVQLLLASVGIFSVRKLKMRESGDSWEVRLAGRDALKFKQDIGSARPRKQAMLEERIRVDGFNTNIDVVPEACTLIRHVFTCAGEQSRREWWRWKREIAGIRRPSRERVRALCDSRPCSEAREQLASMAAADIRWSKVAAVENTGLRQVYDLTVPGPAHFVANGLYAHNTTITRTLLQVFEDAGLSVRMLCAPTGKAAKRAAEATGHEAKTIHRTLEIDKNGHFKHNEKNPLEADVFVIDESSMVDVPLMCAVVGALQVNTRFIIIGDVDQLPSVGPGKVLADIIDSQAIPCVRLRTIFRQAATSHIIKNAHAINRGELPDIGWNEGSDFCFTNISPPDPKNEDDKKKARATIESELLRLARDMYKLGFDPVRDVQVLAPMRKGLLGVESLNTKLQAVLNPTPEAEMELWGTKWRTGDKVMQLRNNYDKNVFNGDIGYVQALDKETRQVLVDFEGNVVAYKANELDELTLAYAFTIHKSQGSEFPVVIMPLDTSHYTMLKRNLLYTGVTRAKKLCVIVGQPFAAKMAVATAQNEERYSRLKDWLRAGLPHELRSAA